MSEQSPLFISALELLGHSVELLESNDDKKNKFIILHLSNAVELILKDMIIDMGLSIYDEGNGKNTINIWKSFKMLENQGVHFTQKPYLEMLIDDRNHIQHKFGFPSKESVVYYLDKTIDFFKDVFEKYYSVSFYDLSDEYFTENGKKLIGLSENMFVQAETISKYDPLSGLSMAYSLFEKYILDLLKIEKSERPIMIWHDKRFFKLLNNVDRSLIDNQYPRDYFKSIRKARNISVHRQHHDIEGNMQLIQDSLKNIEKLKQAIDAIPTDIIDDIRRA